MMLASCRMKEHVRYSADTAQNCMRVAEKTEALRFLGLGSTVRYRVAALPDDGAERHERGEVGRKTKALTFFLELEPAVVGPTDSRLPEELGGRRRGGGASTSSALPHVWPRIARCAADWPPSRRNARPE